MDYKWGPRKRGDLVVSKKRQPEVEQSLSCCSDFNGFMYCDAVDGRINGARCQDNEADCEALQCT